MTPYHDALVEKIRQAWDELGDDPRMITTAIQICRNDPSLDRRPSRSEALALCSYDDAHPARSESSEQWLLAETGLIDRLEAAGYLRPEPVVVPEWEPAPGVVEAFWTKLDYDGFDSAAQAVEDLHNAGYEVVPIAAVYATDGETTE